MATPPPYFIDPSLVYLAIPNLPPPSASTPKQSRALNIFKIFVGIFIILILIAILIALIIVGRQSNQYDLSDSNEKIAKLQRESNENIARLQRESTENLTKLVQQQRIYTENKRLEHQQNLTTKYRFEDQLIASQKHEQDLKLAMQQLNQQINMEERRLQILLQEQQLTEQHRKEDISNANSNLLYAFIQEIISTKEPLNQTIFQLKIESLVQRLDSHHKSLLIRFLYKMNYLNAQHSDTITLDLHGMNLKELDLDDMDINSGQVGLWLNYTQLYLPSTTLINASFEQIYLNKANFSLSNMMGASFRWSHAIQVDFSHATLSLTNFRYTNVFQSNFSNVQMRNAFFQSSNLSQAYLINSDFQSTSFREINAIETSFSHSELSNTDFQYANLYQVQMNHASIRSANFYNAKMIETNFSNGYLPSCLFQWTDLTSSSFRNAFLAGTNFENANVQNVDFTQAILPGAIITPGQLDVALSIANAILPDGSTGKNKNLVNNGNAQCTDMNNTIAYWNNNGDVFIHEVQSNIDCVFQGTMANATLQQKMNVHRYERLIRQGQAKVYIEIQGASASGSFDLSNPPIYMLVQYFDLNNNESGETQSSFDKFRFIPPSIYAASLPCPSNTMELQVTIVFREAYATVDNIYVTME
ncbi:unnamed protein product [Adineta steineri]|uniref:Pentapeptide repeat-containing protein n=1 Tax=Adineta steineri TaxID=433720 RepID=A0A815V289_9BILA|nr:unnamed protein product [Adineta steineri]